MVRFKISGLSLPPNMVNFIKTLVWITIIGVVASIIYSIVEMFSHDRALRVFEGYKVFVIVGNEVYYGKLKVPPRSGGGFELLIPIEYVKEPKQILAYILENYYDTGDEKYLREVLRLIDEFKDKGLVDNGYNLESLKKELWKLLNPWSEPTVVSRKIFSQDLGNLKAIMVFKEFLDDKEYVKRMKELRKVYHPSIFRVAGRKIYNALTYVKDKLISASKTPITYIPTLPAEVRKHIEEAEKKALAAKLPSSYEPLLENSIGRAVTFEFQDIDGKNKRFRGILREYSANYIALYDVKYYLKFEDRFKLLEPINKHPKLLNLKLKVNRIFKRYLRVVDVKVEDKSLVLKLRNESKIEDGKPIKIVKITVGNISKDLNTVLNPSEDITVRIDGIDKVDSPVSIVYEVMFEVDLLLPRSKVKVIGLSDYGGLLWGSL